jgi:hypothetical protein
VGENIGIVGRLLRITVLRNILEKGIVLFIYVYFPFLLLELWTQALNNFNSPVSSKFMLISSSPLAADADGRHVAGQFRGVVARWGVQVGEEGRARSGAEGRPRRQGHRVRPRRLVSGRRR